jgi:hypothetical protein
MIIKKGLMERSLDKVNLPDSFLAFNSVNGWIDIEIMLYILDCVRILSSENEAILLLDCYSVHRNEIIINYAKGKNFYSSRKKQ